nr:MAG TPA: Major capsid protein [Microviridae sp.]
MAKHVRSSIVGFHNIKNKVSRNAFDLSHRHMFTAQIGELLPVFTQWVNPNESFKIGYNGFSRTQPLQTAAFTRLRENIQYYFVPFKSLWKYFEQQVNNMTTGPSGENISRIALSASENSPITTGMPYLNYSWFANVLDSMLRSCSVAIYSAYQAGKKTYQDIADSLDDSVFRYGRLNYASSAKLLRSLGMLNTELDSYDMIANFVAFLNDSDTPSTITRDDFLGSKYGYDVQSIMSNVVKSPNISVFPLLAYHKIVNDHYIYRQWQPYCSYECNIDYLLPNDSMDFSAKLSGGKDSDLPLLRIAQSNLPLDYFNGVLPKAQYGEESAASVDVSSSVAKVNLTGQTTIPTYENNRSSVSPSQSGTLSSDNGTLRAGSYAVSIHTPHTHNIASSASVDISGTSGALKISALRSAIALQKYKEIQESNDPDFASQVLAHFGVKPTHDDTKSLFIGGGDSVIDINPQVNQNLVDNNVADIKATGAGQLSCGCKYTSNTYGIIIGIYRCVPQLDFAHVGLDRNNFKTDASDFPIPELDRIGMQTQYRCEVVAPSIGVKNSNKPSSTTASLDMSVTYGYLPRYAELKTSYDRYEGAFLSSLKSWITGYDFKALTNWLRPTGLSQSYTGIDKLLVCRPSICNNIFLDQSAATVDNDKLLIGSVNTCVAVRPFSVYGLPYSK